MYGWSVFAGACKPARGRRRPLTISRVKPLDGNIITPQSRDGNDHAHPAYPLRAVRLSSARLSASGEVYSSSNLRHSCEGETRTAFTTVHSRGALPSFSLRPSRTSRGGVAEHVLWLPRRPAIARGKAGQHCQQNYHRRSHGMWLASCRHMHNVRMYVRTSRLDQQLLKLH